MINGKPLQDGPQTGWFAGKMNDFHRAHNRLKHTVHTTWKIPLPPWGQFVMGCLYFSIPIVVGYHTSVWAIDKAYANKDERWGGDKAVEIQGLGDKRIVKADDETTHVERLGAGGWGGGVHLVTGDKDTQDINRINLERFLKKQRKAIRRKEKERKMAEADSAQK